MRILLVHNVPIWHPHAGGGQRINHDIGVGLARLGHDVTVIHVGGGENEPSGLPFSTITVSYSGRPLVAAARVARAARRHLRAAGADVVYASAKEGGFLRRVLPPGVGLMATHHHPDPPPLPRLDWFGSPVRSVRLARRSQSALLDAALLRSAHHLTTVSVWSADRLKKLGYVPPDQRFATVRNGLREEWFAPPPDPSGNDATDLFLVGRLDRQKGVDVLLRALARPELHGRTLRVVGDGPDRAVLEGLARDLGVGDRTIFEGGADNDRVRALIRDSHVVALPSRSENYPLVVLEALAASMPVVATTVGGIPEMVKNERHALLVPPDDVTALAAALARLLSDPVLRRRLGAAGRERAEEHRWARILPRVEEELLVTAELAGGQGVG